MKIDTIKIEQIPALIWGNHSDQAILAVHGSHSHKKDASIELLAEKAAQRGIQVISFDLPAHGERIGTEPPCKVQYSVKDLRKVMDYSKQRWSKISLFAYSLGAYFSLLEYANEQLRQALFLSPVVDMQRMITNMMTWFEVTEEQLQKLGEIPTPMGETLYWDYYCYVKEHPIEHWNCDTAILYGENDTLCERDTIVSFTERFSSRLEVVPDAEHFFHTPEQLAAYSAWLEKNLR